jgi:hypothetical protein
MTAHQWAFSPHFAENRKTAFCWKARSSPADGADILFSDFSREAELILHNGKAIFSGKDGTSEQIVSNPAAYFADLMQQYRSPGFSGYPRFTGGFVGYFRI